MIQVGVVGASGYSGLELLKILLGHKSVHVAKLFGDASSGKMIEDVHPSLRKRISRKIDTFRTTGLENLDVLFVALPSGQAMSIVPQALDAGCRVIDLGGDFRLSESALYKKYYGHDHTASKLLSAAVYGLTEWNCPAIKKAELVANPGCYPTSIQLALLPLLKAQVLDDTVLGITSYSGTSGAGKSLSEKMLFTEMHDSVRAYKVGSHQHLPEIDRYLKTFGGSSVRFTFVPHLLPVTRGIYTTIHATVNGGVDDKQITSAFASVYTHSPFVRLSAPGIPEMKDVLHSNFCDIGFVLEGEKLVVLSTLDNLGKGAAGQAVQNMNVMFDLPQTEGLLHAIR